MADDFNVDQTRKPYRDLEGPQAKAHRNSVIYSKQGEAQGQHHHLASDFQSIQPKHRQVGSQDFLYQDLSMFAGAPANASTTVDASGHDNLPT